jgi:hypothetical protein
MMRAQVPIAPVNSSARVDLDQKIGRPAPDLIPVNAASRPDATMQS